MTAQAPAAEPEEFRVVCLCASWCGTCRDYQDGFQALEGNFPHAAFLWLDVEQEHPWGDWLSDLDVENFPTLLIQRRDVVLFFGPMLPQHGILRRTLESFFAQTPEESHAWAHGSPERRAWQDSCRLPVDGV